jgi:excisionase family DNA binding protein
MAEVEELERVLTTSQAARRLSVSSQRVQQFMASGKLPYVLTPLGRLVRVENVDRLAAERQRARAARMQRGREGARP